jgi:hypothetical protein
MSPSTGSFVGSVMGAIAGAIAGSVLNNPERDASYRAGKGISSRYAAESATFTGFLSVVGAVIGGAVGAGVSSPAPNTAITPTP